MNCCLLSESNSKCWKILWMFSRASLLTACCDALKQSNINMARSFPLPSCEITLVTKEHKEEGQLYLAAQLKHWTMQCLWGLHRNGSYTKAIIQLVSISSTVMTRAVPLHWEMPHSSWQHVKWHTAIKTGWRFHKTNGTISRIILWIQAQY